MSYKGKVIEIHGNRAFVLNSKCEYQEVIIIGNVRPGDEIEYSRDDICARSHYSSVKKLAFIAASFVLFFLFSFVAYQQITARSIYAYVALDINPSLEIGINKHYKIAQAIGFNEEGRALIEGSRLLKTNLDLALSEIIKECSTNSYLSSSQTNYIGISLYFPGARDSKALLVHLDEQISKILALNSLNAEVYYLTVDKNTRQEALKNNVSSTKYVLWEQSKKRGFNFDQAENISLKDPRISQIASQIAVKVSHSIKGESRDPIYIHTEKQIDTNNNSHDKPTSSLPAAGRDQPAKEVQPATGEPQNQGISVNPESPNSNPDKGPPGDSIKPGNQQESPPEITPIGESKDKGPIDNEAQNPVSEQPGKNGEQKNTSATGGSGRKGKNF